MLRYFFEVSYAGTQYHGWQIQKNAHSVQGVIQDHLSKKLGAEIEIVGSGRTDAGVHAKKQVFHLDSLKPIDCQVFKDEMNRFLPTDISIKSIYGVKSEAHARFDAIKRSYEYRIATVKDPFDNAFTYQYRSLDIDLLNEGSAHLLGAQDFESFSKVKTDVNNFNCHIVEAKWKVVGNLLVFSVSANRFLRGMVRAMVGTLLEVGLGKQHSKHISNVIRFKDRAKAGHAVPAKGLCLVDVEYPKNIIKE